MVNTSTSSYSGFASVLISSARSIAAVSSVNASARMGMPLLGVYGDAGAVFYTTGCGFGKMNYFQISTVSHF